VVAELTGNASLHLFINVLTQLSAARFLGTAALFDQQAARRASPPVSQPGEIEEIHRVHEAIADAIIAGDTSLAQHRMLKHLNMLAAALGA
jgi:DNA-binding GntR family transcriptional regulator